MTDDDPRQADLRLAESETRYQAVIENASDMIQSVRLDGTFEFVNGAWRSTLGYTDSDLASMTVFDVIHPDSMEHCMVEFVRATRGEPVGFVATKFVAKDGRAIPVEGSVTSRFLGDEVVATHGFFRDISERLRARELEERTVVLEREEQARYLEKMAALGKLSAGLAHELNNPAAALQRANAGLKETLQRRDAAMLTLGASELKPEAWQGMQQILHRTRGERLDPVAISEAEAAIEAWMEDHDVARAWEFAPALAEAGITVTDLAAIAAVVPPTMLTVAITWISETLALSESTEIITHSSRRIADLVQAVKGYSHMDRATESDADIHVGLENTLTILGHRLQNVHVHRQYDRSIPSIRMYGNTLNQVWTNVLDNAIDAMNGVGRIVIRTSTDDDHVVVDIEDNGSGISDDTLPCIFEPFFTLKPQGQGTGLGLDTAWRIVTREHGGTISATSVPGKTVFQIRLPMMHLPQTEDAAP